MKVIKLFKIAISHKTSLDLFNNNHLYIVTIIIFLLFIISLLCLKRTRCIINNVKKYSNSIGQTTVKISDKYNTGFRDFIMSVLIPIISMFSIIDQPISTLIILLTIQFVTYKFYLLSSDFFPNISLAAISNYSVFIGEYKNRTVYVFGNTKDINIIINSQHHALDLEYENPNNILFVLIED
ncbi:hypothetical protein [Fructilactobacillus cliffordii]|uniref:Uncharacterized protein n=1 Tax=Fructilactobacillus cliffordii TaxID=2940299 RepID=A0A9Q9E2J6_9LACO|nr:hypothetical protein [Fructilactobacillus cliffordii]USS89855.1 hypothetical protein M3M40_03530 [Fructilactobacillus cliffordii]